MIESIIFRDRGSREILDVMQPVPENPGDVRRRMRQIEDELGLKAVGGDIQALVVPEMEDEAIQQLRHNSPLEFAA